jgi:hypothetical protein
LNVLSTLARIDPFGRKRLPNHGFRFGVSAAVAVAVYAAVSTSDENDFTAV